MLQHEFGGKLINLAQAKLEYIRVFIRLLSGKSISSPLSAGETANIFLSTTESC
ncbi:MAG: hypothetical protein WAL30_05020 [Candidatus Aquirickettsiella sp.]